METQVPVISEEAVSKLPALHLLQNMGWQYLSPEEALNHRGGRAKEVILEGVLAPWLRQNNHIQHKGEIFPFSEANIFNAIQALHEIPFDGLLRTSESAYNLLCLGKSFQQTIDGNTKSYTVNYIDWDHPENNIFHVTEEFSVEQAGGKNRRRPDLVLFVNGIPFCVIECKSPHIKDPIQEGISQQLGNQNEKEIPSLFIYAQILMVISKNEARYATTLTPKKFWSVWKEASSKTDQALSDLINIQLSEDQYEKILGQHEWLVRETHAPYGQLTRQITEQDRAIYALCRPQRLLELSRKFILYDAGVKKIARYQQYFCVQKLMRQILQPSSGPQRQGGVVWHTQGSGKSLTMVFLAKSIAMNIGITEYKIVLVTDRVDLDEQIFKTFLNCGKDVIQAKTGKHLSQMLSHQQQRIITTVIDKFDACVGKQNITIDDPDIFVLVDEGHRGQYGPRHARMRQTLPNACYIGFTGTPVMKKDRNTVQRFGGIIDAYPIEKAVQDNAVVPLLYEGRHVEQTVDSRGIDAWFKRITSSLTKEQSADLKKKFSTTDQLNKAQQKVMTIAWDISEHYKLHWQGTELKGQLVAQDKATALLYKKFLDDFAMVSSELLVSGPNEREGEDDVFGEDKNAFIRFWKKMMTQYGSEAVYNRQLINSFTHAPHPEIIIVVDKLLTGFDAPKNTILYLTRKLKDHTLLQAIARVNRLCEGKEFGYLIDYRGVLSNLDHALDVYGKLSKFNPEDIRSILTDINEKANGLPECHSILLDTFKSIKNKKDVEAYELLLADIEIRHQFYERLAIYARTLSIALSSEKFLQKTSHEKINMYKRDLHFFSKLRLSVRNRFAEVVDFSEYEPKIQKLLDTHVGTGKIEILTPLVNIFEKDLFEKEVDKLNNPGAKADTIAHRTAKTISERMEQDPAFYTKFSEMLKKTILDFREERIKAMEYLKKVRKIMAAVLNRTGDDLPEMLDGKEVSKAYFGILKDIINMPDQTEATVFEEQIAQIAVMLDSIIMANRIVNWTADMDIQNRMRTEIEDYIFDRSDEMGFEISFDQIDDILNRCIDVAKVRVV
jgi:type I restriction enzyme R subunit